MLSLQVKSLPKKHYTILSALDAFTSGEIPPEKIFIILSGLDAFTSGEIPPK